MRSKEADDYLAEITSRKTPYFKEISGIKLRIDKDVYPTGHLGELFYEALKDTLKEINPCNRVLDYGTGSGFLAIAAAKLGARHVLALDISEAALTCAQFNVNQNQVENIVELRRSIELEALKPDEKFDLIVAGLPWEAADPQNLLEASFYDADFKMRHALFKEGRLRLNQNGRILITYAKHIQNKLPIEQFIEGYHYKILKEKNIKDEPHYIYCITPD